jgi:hypothetical protein
MRVLEVEMIVGWRWEGWGLMVRWGKGVGDGRQQRHVREGECSYVALAFVAAWLLGVGYATTDMRVAGSGL